MLASVFCILEHPDAGGSRVIVTDAHDPTPHLKAGERAIQVPGFTIECPVPFERWPEVVARAEAEGKRHTNRHRFST